MASILSPSEYSQENRPYQPFGSARDVWQAKETEVLACGPAGTGKSRAFLEKAFYLASKHPGARLLFLRKTRASLTTTGLVTFEEKVVPVGHPILRGAQRGQRKEYRFPNGSVIVVGGLDDATKIMSSEYDWAYIQEAIEIDEDDAEAVTSRLRNGMLPYQQLAMDTNPDKPDHWLIQRCLRKQTRLIECSHEDNPVFWDHARSCYTAAGRQYVEGVLDKLTGVRYQRLRLGKWVKAEGAIWTGYDSKIHLCDRDWEAPSDWPRIWVVDFGFTNPFVWQEWVFDPDGRMYRIREIYKTQTLVEDHCIRIKDLTKNSPKPIAVVCDHDAEDRATLERHLGVKTEAAHKSVSDGIQAVASRFKAAGDGYPRIFFMRDSLDERDELLAEAKLPCCTEEELDGYVWDTRGGRRKGEEPRKENDHGCDASRYAVAFKDLASTAFSNVTKQMEALIARTRDKSK